MSGVIKMGAARQLFSNPELMAKLKDASKKTDRDAAMTDIASDLALNMGIPKENQNVVISGDAKAAPTPVAPSPEGTTLSNMSKQRRKRGGTIMESSGLII